MSLFEIPPSAQAALAEREISGAGEQSQESGEDGRSAPDASETLFQGDSDVVEGVTAVVDASLVARARESDPETSHAAADSITPDKLRASQRAVLNVLRLRGGKGTDEQIAESYTRGSWPAQSPSGLRTRRKELVEAGLVEDSGERVTLPSGRDSIVWRVA